jgi:hypothetical protein
MSVKVPEVPRAVAVRIGDDRFTVELEDGRELSVPLEWFPSLRGATRATRSNFRIIGGGIGIHWPDLDEDLSVAGLLGRPHRAPVLTAPEEESSPIPSEELGDEQAPMNGAGPNEADKSS